MLMSMSVVFPGEFSEESSKPSHKPPWSEHTLGIPYGLHLFRDLKIITHRTPNIQAGLELYGAAFHHQNSSKALRNLAKLTYKSEIN